MSMQVDGQVLAALRSLGFDAAALKSQSADVQIGRFVVAARVTSGAYAGAPGAPEVIGSYRLIDPRFGRAPAWLIGLSVRHFVAVVNPGVAPDEANSEEITAFSMRLRPAGGDGDPLYSPLMEAYTAGPLGAAVYETVNQGEVDTTLAQSADAPMPLRSAWVLDTQDAAALQLVYGGGIDAPPTRVGSKQVTSVIYGVLVSKSVLAASPRKSGCDNDKPPALSVQAMGTVI